jgi:hypothetical protein
LKKTLALIEPTRCACPLSTVLIQSSGTEFGFTNGTFGFNVYSPPESNVVIQGSSDLRAWVPLQTNTVSNGLLHYSDPQSAAVPHRFYRALLLP